MSARCPLHRRLLATVAACFLAVAAVLVTAALGGAPVASAASATTAWQNGGFSVNTGGVVSRSDVFLGRPNTSSSQSLPLGNGSLGVAAWAANGFTAQLNRSDTMPGRLSPGQVQIPGLAPMTSASNFTGTLDLYNGVLSESGGGMTMQAWVPAGKDELIVNVTGASPATQETADVHLWSGRSRQHGHHQPAIGDQRPVRAAELHRQHRLGRRPAIRVRGLPLTGHRLAHASAAACTISPWPPNIPP